LFKITDPFLRVGVHCTVQCYARNKAKINSSIVQENSEKVVAIYSKSWVMAWPDLIGSGPLVLSDFHGKTKTFYFNFWQK